MRWGIFRLAGVWRSMLGRLARMFWVKEPISFNVEPLTISDVGEFASSNQVSGASLGAVTLEVYAPRLYQASHFEGTKLSMISGPGMVAFHDCVFQNCTFIRKDNANGIEFSKCTFDKCRFEAGDFGILKIKDSKIRNSNFARGLHVSFLRMQNIQGIETCTGVENIEIESPGMRRVVQDDLAAAPIPFMYRQFSWAKLRGFGSLPFFGFSYVGTAIILFLLSVIELYNSQLMSFHAWSNLSEGSGALAGLVTRFHVIKLDWQTPWLLVGTVLLIFASTIYAWKCPERVKEFSLERWTNELGKEAINYVPLTWRNPVLRVICGTCFYAGGTITAVVLMVRLGEGFSQALRNW